MSLLEMILSLLAQQSFIHILVFKTGLLFPSPRASIKNNDQSLSHILVFSLISVGVRYIRDWQFLRVVLLRNENNS